MLMGATPSAARSARRGVIQQALSCITSAVILDEPFAG